MMMVGLDTDDEIYGWNVWYIMMEKNVETKHKTKKGEI